MSRVESCLLTPDRQLRSSFGRWLLVGLLIHVVASVSASSWPQPPYSVEQIEAFANPDDLEVLYGLSHYQKPGYGKERIHYGTAFLVGYKPKNYTRGKVSIPIPGVETEGVKGIKQEQLSERHEWIDDFSFPAWNENGRLINMKLYSPTGEDLELINQLPHLQSLRIEGPVQEEMLDIGLISTDLPLNAISTMWTKIKGTNQICQLKSLEVVKIAASKVEGYLDTASCSKAIVVLNFASTSFDGLSVSDLPELEMLSLNESEVRGGFVLDGSSLNNLVSLHWDEVEVPSDISRVTLPDSLVQLYLRRTTDSDLSRLKLPENIQYVDLQDAQLGDYSFLEEARNLTALNLEGSDFTQWSMLEQFSKLEHLKVGMTNFSDADLEYISKLKNLQSLDLGLTNITSAESLKDLTALSFLSLPQTKITDLEEIPFIPNLSYLGLPRIENYENRSNWPDAVRRMMETSGSGLECNGLKPCERPPWFE